MIRLALTRAAASLVAAFLMNAPCAFAQQAYSFNVLRQRSIALTAQFWNPILTHVSRKSGVPLKQVHSPLKSGPDIDEAIAFDFVFTNILFTPSRDRLGYRVIARPAGPGLRSQIIVPKATPGVTVVRGIPVWGRDSDHCEIIYDDVRVPAAWVTESPYGQQAAIFGRDPEAIARLVDPLVNQVCRVNLNSQCQRGPDVFPFTGRKDSAEGTLSVTDALRVFSIRTMVAAKASADNKALLTDIARNHRSAFVSTDFIL